MNIIIKEIEHVPSTFITGYQQKYSSIWKHIREMKFDTSIEVDLGEENKNFNTLGFQNFCPQRFPEIRLRFKRIPKGQSRVWVIGKFKREPK